jgi:hypothetical protein
LQQIPLKVRTPSFYYSLTISLELDTWRETIETVLKKQSKPRSSTPTANVMILDPGESQKYTLKLNKKKEQFLNEQDLKDIDFFRNEAWKYKLIGSYSKDHPETPEQGYGCLSKRWATDGQFIITTSQVLSIYIEKCFLLFFV